MTNAQKLTVAKRYLTEHKTKHAPIGTALGRFARERFEQAMEHIKARDYDAARKLYDHPEALVSDKRIIEKRIAEAAP